ncbi:MAG: TRAP transporter substrate-binding protein DctP [Proteobacteria bacterium]|nr:TRAP transporter substrate-binding protein DctP [Pseudomonadota bacterium]
MRNIAKTCLAGLVAGTVAFGTASVAEADEIKVGSFVSAQGFGSRFVIAPWIERATEALKGIGSDTTIKAYWGGTLGKSPFQQYDLVKAGVADVAWVLPANTPGQFPELEIVELPFFFHTAEEASVVSWKLFEMGLFSGFDDTHLVGFFAGEPASIFSRDPVKTLYDLKNKKVRSVGQTQATWLKSIGAVPEAASSSEMNEKLNRGTLSAAIQGWSGMKTFKTLPLVSYTVDVPVGTLGFLLLMNKKTWEGLSAAEKKALQDNGGLMIAKDSGAAYAKAGIDIRAEVKAEGKHTMVTFTDAELAAYEADAKKIWEEWANQTPSNRKAFDAAQKLLKELRSGSAS